MFSSLPQRFQIPPRYARPPLQKGAFGSPPLSKEGQGGFRQQYLSYPRIDLGCSAGRSHASSPGKEVRAHYAKQGSCVVVKGRQGVVALRQAQGDWGGSQNSVRRPFVLSLSKHERGLFGNLLESQLGREYVHKGSNHREKGGSQCAPGYPQPTDLEYRRLGIDAGGRCRATAVVSTTADVSHRWGTTL